MQFALVQVTPPTAALSIHKQRQGEEGGKENRYISNIGQGDLKGNATEGGFFQVMLSKQTL